MADSGSSNTGVVAILVIFVIVAAAGFFAWQGGMFGGRDSDVDVKIEIPAQAPAPAPEKPDNG